MSSCSVYGFNKHIITERTKPRPISLYSKLCLKYEKFLKNKSKINYTILRLGTLYGWSKRMRYDIAINKKIRAVVACGNGTAGIFAPDILKGIGCEVIELDCKLNWNFPKYNPNPEDLEMLHAISKSVKENNADIGFGFDEIGRASCRERV